jgi:hypothetical protein
MSSAFESTGITYSREVPFRFALPAIRFQV